MSRVSSIKCLYVLMALNFCSTVSGLDFETEIRPFLEEKCLGCHNPNIMKGDLSLAAAEDVFEPGRNLVVPGRALASEIYLMATPEEEGEIPEMPEDGTPLTDEEAKLLRQWIDEGAEWPEGLVLKEASKADTSWWAWQPLAEPTHSSIDQYISARLQEDGLQRNGEADRRTLIRRATYDLTGLPPSPEEVDEFVQSQDPDAYAKLIDRLLESPHYGERWGRHWLDVVRFGESNGFERNFIINDLWPFRDYVIRSINEDKPFDQFIREHLAGDVFGRDDPNVAIGSAFLVAGPYDDVGNQDPKAKRQIRANTLDEIINSTGQAFLGMTIGCARCHDHKFDAISQRDYYKMYATFAGVRHGRTTLATADEKQANRDALAPLNQRKAAAEKAIKAIDDAVLARANERISDFESAWTRPATDRTGTEEIIEETTARFIRLTCEAVDSRLEAQNFKIDEFEIWSAEPESRNVALASNGSVATGAARVNEDFPGVYGPHLAIDGKTGERFISGRPELTIELPEPTQINRIVFSSARGEANPEHGTFGGFPVEYRIEVSLDGETWTEVTNGKNRKPANDNHRNYRLLRAEMTEEEAREKQQQQQELNVANVEIAKVPKLPQAWMGTRNADDAAGPFHLFIGGSPERTGETVVPASLSTLQSVVPHYEMAEDSTEDQRRLELANWITHPDNPTTARVLANRLWHYHFGTGIVDTPNDFGYMGGTPTHPELLDFLASELKKNNWQLKSMHRMIMMSGTYRQSSEFRAEAAEVDGDSRLLWRFPPRRLSAEEIRDTILAVSGKLDTEMGGPGFRLYKYMSDNVSTYEPMDEHGPETYRRAVFHQNARASVVDLMTEFDQPDCAFSSPRRAQTTTPLQALTMLNHNFTIDMAEAFAERVSEGSAEDQAMRVFQIAYQREPTDDEIGALVGAIDESGLRGVCRAVLNSSELIYLD